MPRSKPSRQDSRDLPPDLELVSCLSESARGQVLEVLRGEQRCVLRIGLQDQAAPAALLASLDAPGLVAPTEWGFTPAGRPYLLRPFVLGSCFDEAAAHEDVSTVEGWAASLLETLAVLHDAGLVHRDVKAANVIVGATGPVLVDLDLVVRQDSLGEGAGSRFHLAPEVLLGQPVTPAADLFSLGVMLALALCGQPSRSFTRDFPAKSFWAASGLSPSSLSGELGSLVRQLVCRHPADRPCDARAAAAQLRGSADSLTPLGLSFLGGRDTALKRLLAALEVQPGTRLAVLIPVADGEERAALVDTLELGLTMANRRVSRAALEDPLWSGIDRIAAAADGCMLLDAPGPEQGATPVLLAELVAAWLSGREGSQGVLGLVLDEASARQVADELPSRVFDEELSLVRTQPWPRVPVVALARHLDRLTGGASPEVAKRLAASLHAATIGRRSDLDRALAQAVERGVLRPDPPRYTLLREEWPRDALTDGQAGGVDLDSLPDGARQLLAALHCCRWAPTPAELLALAGGSMDERSGEVVRLERLGVVRRTAGPFGPLETLDPRWTAAAASALKAPARRKLATRALDVARERGSSELVLARQQLLLAAGPEDLAVVLDAAANLLEAGRLGPARALVQASAALSEGASEARRGVLEARVELAQGGAQRALDTLREHFGPTFDEADHETLLVAAHAAEQCGERALSRGLNERILSGDPDRHALLRATVGLGYALLLDGDLEGAARCVAEPANGDDDDRAASALLNLQAVILTRQGDPAAEARFDQALERARRADDPLLLARTELNRAHHDRRQGATARALEALERAEQSFARAGHVHGRALALNNIGVIERDRGELNRCRARLREALALRRRVGDVHGAGSSLGSLAAAELEAGHVGVALETLRRARRTFASGDYQREVAFLDVHEAMAMACAGHHRDAARRLTEASIESLRRERPALVLRVEALLLLLGNERQRAAERASQALDLARKHGVGAELFRCATVLLCADPGHEQARADARQAAEALDAPVRRAEIAWRTADPEALGDSARLSDWLTLFEQAGRTDLTAAVARMLAESLDAAGDRGGRRVARSRAGQAADALVDGLPHSDREACLERLARLSGPQPGSATQGTNLSVDWLLACNRRMAEESDIEQLLLAIVDMALDVTGSRRGFLVLLDGEQVSVQVARNMGSREMAPEEARFSRTLVHEAVREGRVVMTTDAGADARFAGARSISSFRLRSVLCVPLPGTEGGGALYLDDDQREAAFDETDVERVGALADQAAVAIAQLRRRAEIETLNTRLADRVAYTEDELDKARAALRRQGRVAPLAGMVGESESMASVFELVERVAPTELSVLVSGPSGSGKDLVSRALHERSDRAAGPLIIENVAAVPANLLESEMFGHVRGAFTGAERDRPGLFAQADGGTFVLDEIGELPLELQPKLLRVLESGEVRPVGSTRVQRVDVRIVAATNRDLLERVRAGEFRQDLYYRLNAVEIRLPGLEQRIEDIPLLVAHALERLNARHGTTKSVSDEVMLACMRRSWPGQVRELLNEVARLYFLCDEVLDRVDLVREPAEDLGAGSEPMPASFRLEDLERVAIERAMRAAGGKKEQAARLLGISRAGLYAKLRRLDSQDEGTKG